MRLLSARARRARASTVFESQGSVLNPSRRIVDVVDAVLHYDGGQVLRGVNMSMDMGETLVLCGPSGSGKSSLLRCINGLETLTAGEVHVVGQAVTGASRSQMRRLRRQVGMVPQHFDLYPNLTATGNVALAPRRVLGLSRAEAEQRAGELLQRVGLGDKSACYPAQLSGGQQQRVAIARALAMRPKLLLFDEPTSALDPEMIREVLDVMRELAHEGMTMLVVTHEMGFARDVADRVALLDEGQIVEYGSPEQLFERPQHDRTRRFIEAISSGERGARRSSEPGGLPLPRPAEVASENLSGYGRPQLY